MLAQNYAYQGVEALTRRWHCLDMDIREARGLLRCQDIHGSPAGKQKLTCQKYSYWALTGE